MLSLASDPLCRGAAEETRPPQQQQEEDPEREESAGRHDLLGSVRKDERR